MTDRLCHRVLRLVKWFLPFYLLTFLPLSAFAQRLIEGQVVDVQTGEPVPFASAQYKGHNLGVASDIEGRFQIERHNGWTLTFSAVGYVSTTVMINHNVKGHYTVRLKADNTVLKEVTVKARRGRYSRRNRCCREVLQGGYS